MIKSLVVAVAALLGVHGAADAAPVFQYTSTETSQAAVNATFGYSFNVASAITVTAVSYYRASAAGSTVRIYNAAGTLFSGLVRSTDPTVTVGNTTLNQAVIAPLTLAQGLYYIVGEVPANTPNVNFNAANLSSSLSQVTFGAGVSQGGYGNPIANGFNGGSANSYLLVNFEAAAAAVPEPASWALMIVGFGAVGTAARRRRTTVAFA